MTKQIIIKTLIIVIDLLITGILYFLVPIYLQFAIAWIGGVLGLGCCNLISNKLKE